MVGANALKHKCQASRFQRVDPQPGVTHSSNGWASSFHGAVRGAGGLFQKVIAAPASRTVMSPIARSCAVVAHRMDVLELLRGQLEDADADLHCEMVKAFAETLMGPRPIRCAALLTRSALPSGCVGGTGTGCAAGTPGSGRSTCASRNCGRGRTAVTGCWMRELGRSGPSSRSSPRPTQRESPPAGSPVCARPWGSSRCRRSQVSEMAKEVRRAGRRLPSPTPGLGPLHLPAGRHGFHQGLRGRPGSQPCLPLGRRRQHRRE